MTQRSTSAHKAKITGNYDRQDNRNKETLRAIVRLLARQAAEKDFEALVKAQEAANDN